MTKEEIIHRLQYARHRIDNVTYAPDVLKAIDIAIEAVGNTDADTISSRAAIEALTKDKKALEHIINGMSGYEKEFDRFVGQRNQVDYDIYAIKQLPPANCSEFPNSSDTISRQTAQRLFGKALTYKEQIGKLTWTTSEVKQWLADCIEQLPPAQLSTNLAEVGTDCISRQAAIGALRAMQTYKLFAGDDMLLIDQAGAQTELMLLPSTQPEIIRCKDCKHWIPYDWMFSEVWRSKNMADYPEDEIGCNYCDMTMKANDFCSRGERRE